MKKLWALVLPLCLCGCMSNKEFVLRNGDLEAKKAWPATYQAVVLKGPLSLDKDSELVVSVPNMPYQHTPIPDGQAIQANLVKDIAHTGAILYGATYGIRKASGKSTTINNNTTGGAE